MGFVVVKVALVQFLFQVRRCIPIDNIPCTFCSQSLLYRRRCKPKKLRTEWQIDETRDFFLHVCNYIRLVRYSRRSGSSLHVLVIRSIIIKYW